MVFKKLKSAIDKKKEDIVKPEEPTIVNDSDIYSAWSSKGIDITSLPNLANKTVSSEEIDNIPRECSGIPYPLSNEQYKAVKNIIKWINDVSSYLSTSYDYEAPFRRLAGYAGCVDEESLILTDRGLMRLKDIILLQRKDLNFLGFEKFTKNLMVLSHDKTWNPITDIYATEEDTEGYIITTESGNKIKCSWKHPLYTINPKGVYEWVKAIDLKVGQQIGIYVNNDTYEFEKICEDKFFWDEIISIEPIKQKFYDISVKDKSSFICNNMISHNTGKTACISYLLTEGYKYFPSYMREKQIAVCTFTWKAALVLQSRGIYNASSIHGLLYKPQENDKGELYFVRRDKFEVMSAYSMIVVDEASMVDRKMRRDIQSYGLPVLYVGDKGQLPPISSNPADALIDNNFMAEAEDSLEEINRQAKDSPIIRLSMDIRNGKSIKYGKYGKGVFKITEDELIAEQNELLPKMSQLICGTNDCRRAANSFMRRLYGYNRKRMPVKGEKLIGLSNVLSKGLYNGQAWLCDDEDASSYSLSDSKNVSLSLVSPDNSDRRLNKCIFPEDNLFKSEKISEAQIFKYLKDMEIYSVDFGYCITCHKSQGSSFDKVLVFEEKIGDKEFHKRWLYTSVTRAISKLIIVS